jgi:hypothetical protein
MTDPTNTITTGQQAQVLARAMLRLAPDPADEVWQTISEPMLTELLHTASPAVGGGGLRWVDDAAVNALAASTGNAAGAVGISAGAAGAALAILDDLDSAERTSIVTTIKAAVTPWIAVPA